jgi:hypothetical protein
MLAAVYGFGCRPGRRGRRVGPPRRTGANRWCRARRPWQGEVVSELTSATTPATWLDFPDVAERLGVAVTKIHQMVRDGALLAFRRDGVRQVPVELVANRTVLRHLPGVITLLRDAGYDDEEALRWLFQPDDTLPGTPAQALAGAQATEVKRRAQALGF